MSTVTARELHRNTAAVLKLSRDTGEVIVLCRNGEQYRVVPVDKPAAEKPKWPDFKARARRIFPEPIPADICAKVDKAIRGE